MSDITTPSTLRASDPKGQDQPIPCVLVAAGPTLVAERAALAAGLEPRVVLTKRQCAGRLRGERLRADRLGARVVAIHSADWSREPLPQLLELAALRLGARECIVLDGAGGRSRVGRLALAARAAGLPFEVALAVAMVGREVGAFAVERRVTPQSMPRGDGARPTLFAIWPSGAQIGGSVTHMAGVLAGFRALGFRVALVALAPPPEQMAALVDDLEVAPPLPRRARLSAEISAIRSSRAAVDAGLRLLSRLRPSLVYQRHEAFLTCGGTLASRASVPLVLEWNNSEAWARQYWHATHLAKRAFNPLLWAMEASVLARADLVAAVSRQSASMALAGGADARHVVVIPNAADLDPIDDALAAVRGEADGSHATVGWVGSFFQWHGAEILVRALAQLPADVGAVMVGDGPERAACQALANELGVATRIEWAGQLPHDQALRRLAGCDVLASPHVPMPDHPFFGSPTKVFEYMALGVPIVASALEQIGEILDNDRTALLVAPGSSQALADAISRILAMPDRGRRLGLEARREAQLSHTWEARAAALVQALWPAEGVSEVRSATAGDGSLEGLGRPFESE